MVVLLGFDLKLPVTSVKIVIKDATKMFGGK